MASGLCSPSYSYSQPTNPNRNPYTGCIVSHFNLAGCLAHIVVRIRLSAPAISPRVSSCRSWCCFLRLLSVTGRYLAAPYCRSALRAPLIVVSPPARSSIYLVMHVCCPLFDPAQ